MILTEKLKKGGRCFPITLKDGDARIGYRHYPAGDFLYSLKAAMEGKKAWCGGHSFTRWNHIITIQPYRISLEGAREVISNLEAAGVVATQPKFLRGSRYIWCVGGSKSYNPY